MADLPESSVWETGVYQIETTDLVLGGASGVPNQQAGDLANRTLYLLDRLNSLTEQPLAAIPYPTIATPDHRLVVTPAAATAGGTVSIAAEGLLTLAEDVVAATTGRLRTFTTSAYTSADLVANSLYYLRAQVDGNGDLEIYTQRGADDDAPPPGLLGTPDAASGGGFDSTKLDVLLARVQTGTAGTAPTVDELANADRFSLDFFDHIIATSATALITKTQSINLARKIEPIVSPHAWSLTDPTGGTPFGNYRDGSLVTVNRVVDVNAIPQGVFCFASNVSRYAIEVAVENIESNAVNELNNTVWYHIAIR